MKTQIQTANWNKTNSGLFYILCATWNLELELSIIYDLNNLTSQDIKQCCIPPKPSMDLERPTSIYLDGTKHAEHMQKVGKFAYLSM